MSLDVLNLLLVVTAALAGGWVARRFNYPSILGELIGGIVLGPPLLGILSPDDALAVIGKLGVVLLMLYIGIHLDPTALGRAARPGALAAAGGFVVPAALGFGLMMLVDGDAIAAAFVAVAMGVTSLATKSRILVDLGILNTRVAHVLMAGALFSDVAALVIFAALLSFAATGTLAVAGIAATAAQAVAFVAAALLIGSKVFPWVGAKVLAKRTIEPSSLFLGVVAVGLAFAAAADLVGLHAILGAFLAGLFIREGVLPRDQLKLVETRARNVSVGLLAPVFFVTAGFRVSFDVFTDSLGLLIAVIAVATVGKVLGTALFYQRTGFGFREGVAVGSGMNGRGAVEIIVAELALEAGIIDERVFSILVFMAIFTTATVPVLLTKSIAWLRRSGELVADERTGVVILGAGATALRLGRVLAGTRPVTLIDTNAEHCATASAAGLDVIKGSGLDESVLERAGLERAQGFIATTANPEVNLLAAGIATRRFGVPQVQATLPTDASKGMLALLDETSSSLAFGRPTDIASWDVDIERGQVSETRIEIDDFDQIDWSAPPGAQVDSHSTTLPLAVRSGRDVRPYRAGQQLVEGDVVIAMERLGSDTSSGTDGLDDRPIGETAVG